MTAAIEMRDFKGMDQPNHWRGIPAIQNN